MGLGVPVTCSFGVSTARAKLDAQPLLEQADIALYRAKRNGGDRVELETSAATAVAV